MGTTQPIRDKDELKNFIAYYEVAHPNIRNYTMIILGLYTALRISDVLNLKWKDVYYFEKDCFLDHLLIHGRPVPSAFSFTTPSISSNVSL